jgi:hypothetical protein
MEMDEPLAKITEGDWDPSVMSKKRLVIKTKERKVTVLRNKVFPLYNAREYKATIAAIDEATSADPELAGELAWLKFASLCNGGDVEAGLNLGAKLFEINKGNPLTKPAPTGSSSKYRAAISQGAQTKHRGFRRFRAYSPGGFTVSAFVFGRPDRRGTETTTQMDGNEDAL